MRVVLLCGAFVPDRDGVADYTARLRDHLRARGVEVAVVGAEPGGEWGPGGVARAAARLRRARPDVVHLQWAPSAFGYRPAIGALPGALAGGPALVTTLHEYGWWSWRPGWVPARAAEAAWAAGEARGWWDREAGRLTLRSGALVVTNTAHAGALRARLDGRTPPVRIVPIGANVPAPAPLSPAQRAAVRAELGVAPDAPLLAFFGFVHAVKGIRFLLEAVARLRARRPGLRLLLVGGFESLALREREAREYRDEVAAMVAGHGLEAAVTVTGFRPAEEVSRLLHAADVGVLPFTAGLTLKSGSLLAVLGHGLPLVGTAADPPDPALRDGEHALLVAPRDAGALAGALARVLDEPALGARLASRGRELARAHDWGPIADAHHRLYADVLSR